MVKMIFYSQLFKNLVAQIMFDPIFAFNSYNYKSGPQGPLYMFLNEKATL
jgi:hypothetical protein